MPTANLSALIADFSRSYDAEKKDRIWRTQSEAFRAFIRDRITAQTPGPISDEECDKIIRILDRHGKGNTKDSEAVARAMVAQGAWRRIFNELNSNGRLGSLVSRILQADPEKRADLVDELYKVNEGQKNNLTGPSANVINAFLAAYDPMNNLSIISLRDRRALIEYLGLSVTFDWSTESIGSVIVSTNDLLLRSLRERGVAGSARTVSRFCYFAPMAALWKGEHTVRKTNATVSVVIPRDREDDEGNRAGSEDLRESFQIQALIAKIGAEMGFGIWLPKADRGRVLRLWTPEPNQLLDELPLGYDESTMKTIEQIDVIWLRKRSISRAFEIEHTTSVYSGLLRMADLIALQPDINIRLHIVAPAAKRDKVMQEIQRPVFSLLEGRALGDICTYLSYDSLRTLGEERHLARMSDKVIEDYEECVPREEE